MINFNCPTCNQLHEVYDDEAGKKFFCPSCRKELVVPRKNTLVPLCLTLLTLGVMMGGGVGLLVGLLVNTNPQTPTEEVAKVPPAPPVVKPEVTEEEKPCCAPVSKVSLITSNPKPLVPPPLPPAPKPEPVTKVAPPVQPVPPPKDELFFCETDFEISARWLAYHSMRKPALTGNTFRDQDEEERFNEMFKAVAGRRIDWVMTVNSVRNEDVVLQHLLVKFRQRRTSQTIIGIRAGRNGDSDTGTFLHNNEEWVRKLLPGDRVKLSGTVADCNPINNSFTIDDYVLSPYVAPPPEPLQGMTQIGVAKKP